MDNDETTRRPIKTREAWWAVKIAKSLKIFGFTPDFISISSVFCALLAGAAFAATRFFPAASVKLPLFVVGALFIQGRLLCNLFDGMVAIEGGMKSASGEIFNDFPDRISDILIMVGAGYSITFLQWGPELGWTAACLALLTAYARVLGRSCGAKHYFNGPMAKQHRMALITIAALGAGVESFFSKNNWIMTVALAIIILGAAMTIGRRLKLIVKELKHD